MNINLFEGLAEKLITKKELKEKVRGDFDLIPELVENMNSSKAAIRYGCGKILMELSEEYPEKLYPFMDSFIDLLDSRYRILVWNAIAIISNLTIIDNEKRFDAIFDKYFDLLNDEYMVTVANLVVNSRKIALSKPYLIERIVDKLLEVESISVTPHLSEECKKVIEENTIMTFNGIFDQIEQKERIFSFVRKYTDSQRKTLRTKAEMFLKRWS